MAMLNKSILAHTTCSSAWRLLSQAKSVFDSLELEGVSFNVVGLNRFPNECDHFDE